VEASGPSPLAALYTLSLIEAVNHDI